MPDRPQMAHLDAKGPRGRFRFRFPTTYEGIALIFSIGCALKDVPDGAWAALASVVP